MALKNLVQGFLGNMSEQSPEQLGSEFGMYLMRDEVIATGYKLVRDVVIITDKRILRFDKQGATGQKMRIESINLFTVVKVTAETAGFGFDDSELSITYLTTPLLATHSPEFSSMKFEFPKKFNIQPLYVMLQELAYNNCVNINS